MSVRAFIDTNVLVYTVTEHDPRRMRAIELLAEGGVVSVQVLNEFADVMRRRYRRDVAEITFALDRFVALLDPPIPLTHELHRAALDIVGRYGFRIYDSLIIAAARQSGCNVLYTEDLQGGQTIDGLVVRNPFAP